MPLINSVLLGTVDAETTAACRAQAAAAASSAASVPGRRVGDGVDDARLQLAYALALSRDPREVGEAEELAESLGAELRSGLAEENDGAVGTTSDSPDVDATARRTIELMSLREAAQQADYVRLASGWEVKRPGRDRSTSVTLGGSETTLAHPARTAFCPHPTPSPHRSRSAAAAYRMGRYGKARSRLRALIDETRDPGGGGGHRQARRLLAEVDGQVMRDGLAGAAVAGAVLFGGAAAIVGLAGFVMGGRRSGGRGK